MYDIKNLNIWKKDSQSQLQMTRSGMKVISKDKVYYPIYTGREFMESDLAALNMSVRSYNGLRRAGWKNVGELVDSIESEQDLARIRNLGKNSINEIMTKLVDYNKSLLTPGEMIVYRRKFNLLNGIDEAIIDNSLSGAVSTADVDIKSHIRTVGINNTLDRHPNIKSEPVFIDETLFDTDGDDGEYARLKKIFKNEGIEINNPRVGEFSFPIYKELLNEPIDVLRLSTRPYNALRRQGIELLTEIPKSAELRNIRNLGMTSIYEIMDKFFVYHYYRLNEDKRYSYLEGIRAKYYANRVSVNDK